MADGRWANCNGYFAFVKQANVRHGRRIQLTWPKSVLTFQIESESHRLPGHLHNPILCQLFLRVSCNHSVHTWHRRQLQLEFVIWRLFPVSDECYVLCCRWCEWVCTNQIIVFLSLSLSITAPLNVKCQNRFASTIT